MSEYCDIAKPLGANASDSTDTLNEIERHNAKWYELCGQ